MVKLHLKIKIEKGAEEKLHKIGRFLVERMKKTLVMNIGKPTKLTESIKYRVENNTVIIYTDNEILTFIEEGTKPHKIRPKNKKLLVFEANKRGTRKDGSKFVYGDLIFAKVVNHPGTDPKPFFSSVFFESEGVIKQFLNEK